MTPWQEKYPIKSEWKTRGGWKAMVVDHTEDEIIVYHNKALLPHNTDGTSPTPSNSYDLLTPWKEPLTGEVWLNVYAKAQELIYQAHDDREEADGCANWDSNRIGRMRVQLEERWDE
jgi:hypothetical protein